MSIIGPLRNLAITPWGPDQVTDNDFEEDKARDAWPDPMAIERRATKRVCRSKLLCFEIVRYFTDRGSRNCESTEVTGHR